MQQYSRIAIFLHWTIAALLAFQISVGWALEDLGVRGFTLFQLHKSVGVTILLLTLARIAVRYWKPRPAPVEGGWQGALAKAVHAGLYIFMLAAPLTGWALVSTAKVKVPTLIFGLVPLPHLPLPMRAHELAENAHGLLAWLGIALFLLHVAGALRHHILLRDGLLWRMMPVRSPVLLVLLPMLVLAAFGVERAILPSPSPAKAPTPPFVMPVPPTKEEAALSNEANAAAPTESDNAVAAEEEAVKPPPAWAVQPGGRVGFTIGNSGEMLKGSFASWSAKIVMDPDHPESADIRVNIDLSSASIGDSYKDGMLKGEEFFDVAAHPAATFTAKGAERKGANSYTARGTLTLKGVSRPQTIRFTLAGSGETRTVSGSASIARTPFGVGTGESGAGLDASAAVTFDFKAKTR